MLFLLPPATLLLISHLIKNIELKDQRLRFRTIVSMVKAAKLKKNYRMQIETEMIQNKKSAS